ncbi:ribonuclease D [Phycicoccus sp. CSK15P-2]|uniref:ribonuclease D n=1 Tax=Phycicoccus sp. CSK15P-2 TaxID=2807627 RepID=UPI0019510742|nr:HRDC domain-containing protein [Phycicoccus sp. CSK15P-2]MBM6403968.1 ribonuclease D [Phycicoccus sp. CSK15P-2]
MTVPPHSTPPDEPDGEGEIDVPEPVPLDEPADGVPPVVESERGLDEVARAVASGVGPVAIDAERASGYRYGQRAYLVQLRREGAGTWLVDPVAVPDLSPVDDAIGAAEWILHAATQDLACLAEVGLRPRQLFDTELAARILGLPRVGLAAVVERYLGLRLAKEHSAVDWSTRPLPDPWLRYAALDVEVLGELRNLMGVDLASQDKDEWARQEFAALLSWAPVERVDPWRRTSGINTLRQRRAIGIVRELWYARDAIARERDISVGRVLPDASLVEIAKASPRSPEDLPRGHRAIQRYGRQWVEAVGRAHEIPEGELPLRSLPSDGPPPPRVWGDKNPVAAERLGATRALLTAFAEEHTIPVENVCSPDPLRRVVWTPPGDHDAETFTEALRGYGVRPWQAEIVAPMLVATFAAHPG